MRARPKQHVPRRFAHTIMDIGTPTTAGTGTAHVADTTVKGCLRGR